LVSQGEFAKGVAVQLLSAAHDDPCTEVVGLGVLHGMPRESVHCKTIEEDEFSVQVMTSMKDDHDLQCPIEDEDVLTMKQVMSHFIRWHASDLRRAEVEGRTRLVCERRAESGERR
jgi:hypothetical protein